MESIDVKDEISATLGVSEIVLDTETPSQLITSLCTTEDASSDASPSVGHYARTLTPEEIETLKKHDSSLVSEFKKNKLELEAAKNWDLFYKRNKTNFYKDRHWTLREFEELSGIEDGTKKVDLIVLGEIRVMIVLVSWRCIFEMYLLGRN